MNISIKKEIDLVAIFALGVSAVALWQSYQSNDGYIVKGGDRALVLPYKVGDCQTLVSIPVSFHNSGKRAVSLERFIPADNVPSLIFLKNQEIVEEVNVNYKLHIFEGKLHSPKMIFNLLKTTPEYPLESFKHLNKLIKPGDSFEASFVVTAQDYVNGEKVLDYIMVAIDAEFSNGQLLENRSAIDLKTNSSRVCNS
ncbi:hypothetical protein LJ739_13970 [Aestuariibacter halophilus]|uniref:Uncharacterized protein n=1 Tax=Fluctibacter halophilus TaxID=226011 RepID=A0ABS8G9U8_9ALTE|nr:hypothetical protein [Aestuariibacter halophilus]MCC2617354.1 hypothetical protein [Aestuariibacter halophilus]